MTFAILAMIVTLGLILTVAIARFRSIEIYNAIGVGLIIFVGVTLIAWYYTGYKHGQEDAMNGKYKYVKQYIMQNGVVVNSTYVLNRKYEQ